MTDLLTHVPDPRLDLVLERVIDVPRELVWKAWTTPGILMRWFTPAPWSTVACDLDLRPGGIFRTVMRSPDGEEFPNEGCCLEVVDQRKFVFTNAMAPGYRPVLRAKGGVDFPFTAVISLESVGTGTRYTALVIHADEESCTQHRTMGFHDGWGSALDQLVALAPSIGSDRP
jgi:uncharacterized protein YndB with AHSA1/START domain